MDRSLLLTSEDCGCICGRRADLCSVMQVCHPSNSACVERERRWNRLYGSCWIHKFHSPRWPSFARIDASCGAESAFLLNVSASARCLLSRLYAGRLPRGLALRTWLHVVSCFWFNRHGGRRLATTYLIYNWGRPSIWYSLICIQNPARDVQKRKYW